MDTKLEPKNKPFGGLTADQLSFINDCRKLYHVERSQVPWMTDAQWDGLQYNPVDVLVRLPDAQAHALLEAANVG